MSTRTKSRSQHRETPTQALRRQLAEAEARPDLVETERLRADNARLDAAVRDLTAVLATVSEHRFGDEAAVCIVARRHGDTDRWAVQDATLMAARFWGRDGTWHSTSERAPVAVMFPWSLDEARRHARILAGQPLPPAEALPPVAVDAPEAPEPIEGPGHGFVCGPVITLDQLAAHRAQAEVATDQKADTVSVPAPADVPGFVPEPPDPAEADTILTPLAASISANTADDTVALPQARVHGPEQTQAIPVTPIPPKPKHPPRVAPLHLPLPCLTWGVGHIATTVPGRSIPVRLATAH